MQLKKITGAKSLNEIIVIDLPIFLVNGLKKITRPFSMTSDIMSFLDLKTNIPPQQPNALTDILSKPFCQS